MHHPNPAAPAEMFSIHGKLKEKTSEAHISLEQLPISRAMMSPELSTEEYLRYLKAMADVISGVELNVYPKLYGIFTDINERQKLKSLLTDLGGEVHVQPLFEGNYSEAFCAGILYVIEGSMLGGKFILQNVRAVLGDQAGTLYFNGYGNRTGIMWKSFLRQLEEFATEDNADEIVSGAIYAFETIRSHFASAA